VSWGTADDIDRTAKILIDANRATDPTDASRVLENLVLQVAVGPDITIDPAAQAAVATVVNAGRRAFHGGVHATLAIDPVLTTGWTAGRTASAVVTGYGGTLVDTLSDMHPTLVIGTPTIEVVGAPVLHLTWNGWSAGLVQDRDERTRVCGIAPSGVLAASLGISECFQQALGAVVPGRRDVGLSLWRPDLDWHCADAAGPPLEYLPAAVWLLGLGHLGQAYAWTLGMLPYAVPGECHVALMDFDIVVAGNTATQLLVTGGDVKRRKTRVAADALESLGMRTRVVERAFDEHMHPVPHADPRHDEPLVALAGFDDPAPRRLLGRAGFERVVDAGIGAGPVEYLDMVLHTFPGSEDPSAAFPDVPPRRRALGDAYEAEIARQTAAGAGEEAASCGILDIAGVTVGAAFVGAVASTLVVGDLLRVLHEGTEYSVVALDLHSPDGCKAVPNIAAGSYIPRATPARPA